MRMANTRVQESYSPLNVFLSLLNRMMWLKRQMKSSNRMMRLKRGSGWEGGVQISVVS